MEAEEEQCTLTWSCEGRQKMWASSWVKPRTRIRPCSVPERSYLHTRPTRTRQYISRSPSDINQYMKPHIPIVLLDLRVHGFDGCLLWTYR